MLTSLVTTKKNNEGTILDLARSVFDREAQALTVQRDMLDESFARAVNLLLATKGRIITCGIGKSGIIAHKIAAVFSSIGKSSSFLNAAEASHGDLGVIQQHDTVMILSYSGSSLELANVTSFCKQRNIPIIALLGNKESLLYARADISILIPANCEVAHIKQIPTTSATLMNVIGDALVTVIAQAMQVKEEEYKLYHPGGNIGHSLRKVGEIMRVKDSVPIAHESDTMSDALVLMTQKSLGCLVVIDSNGNLSGMVTDGDLRRHMSEQLVHMKVSEVMTHNPKTVSSGMLVAEALEYMNARGITNLIVADDGAIAGIVHIHDCLRTSFKDEE
jgi:arabinose-5-phosphate isomerase